MKRFHLTVMALGLAFLVGGCGEGALTDFESNEHKFKVKLPGTPKTQKQNVAGLEQTIYTVEGRGGAYVVSYNQNPPGTQGLEEVMLKGAVQGMSTKGTVKSETPIKLDGKYPGAEVKMDVTTPQKGEMINRIYIVENRLYQVMAVGTSSFIKSSNVQKFLDSFQVTP